MIKFVLRVLIFLAVFNFSGFVKPIDGWQAFFVILVLVNLVLIWQIYRNRKVKL